MERTTSANHDCEQRPDDCDRRLFSGPAARLGSSLSNHTTLGGGQAAALHLHIYQLLDVPASAINFDPFTRKIYAVLLSTSTTITGNSLVVIDPANGSVGSPIQVGSDPNLLSETSDGNYLYIGLSGAKSLSRFNLLNQTLDLTVPIISTSVYSSGNVAASPSPQYLAPTRALPWNSGMPQA